MEKEIKQQMNRYPIYIKYKDNVITRKTTGDTLSSLQDVKSLVIQAFPLVKEKGSLHLFWCKHKYGPLHQLINEQDYIDLAHWHTQNYSSYINVYDSVDEVILIDKEEWKQSINKINELFE